MIRSVAIEALARIDQLLPAWLPDGRKEGHEWSATNPTRADLHPGSFKVNMSKGAWADFAGDAKGGDLVSLFAYLRGLAQGEAARQLAGELGMDLDQLPKHRPAAVDKPAREVEAMPGVALVPWPADHPALDHPRRSLYRGGIDYPCTGCWIYRDRAGLGLFAITRHDTSPRKTIMPWHLREIASKPTWSPKYPEQFADHGRPLYGLDRLAERPEAPVLVVEGEKSADAASILLPAYVVVTSPGGGKASSKADWSPMFTRKVVIWPDHDAPGQSYAAAVAMACLSAGAVMVQTVDLDALIERHGLPAELPAGFDAADWPAGTPCDLTGCLVAAATTARVPAPEVPAAPLPSATLALQEGDPADQRRGRKHTFLINAIRRFLADRHLVPDALDGWRASNDWSMVAEDVLTLASDLAYELRAAGSWSMAYVTETMEKVVRDMRRIRRAEIMARITGRATSPDGLNALGEFVLGITGRNDPTDLAVMRHWFWLAKRQALGLPCEHHLMVVIFGAQGSGKTTALSCVAKPLEELALDIDVSYLTDERRVRALAHLVLGRWEEMSGSTKADLEALKHQITSPTISYRPMRSNSTVVLPRTCSFLGTSNIPVQDMVQDTTGARRFYELRTPARCDWGKLDAIDPIDLWACVSETERAPILDVMSGLRSQQVELVHRDAVSLWLEEESWGAMAVRIGDADPDHHQNLLIGYHAPEHGEPFEHIAARFRRWCGIVGQPPIGSKTLAARLRQEGFRRGEINRHKEDPQSRHYRVWMRPPPPSSATPASPQQGNVA